MPRPAKLLAPSVVPIAAENLSSPCPLRFLRARRLPRLRKALCSEVQKILADDLPYLPLWFGDVVSVHRRSLGDLHLSPTGDFDFLSR